MVNSDGRRFANEASNYNVRRRAAQLDPTRFDYVNLPCWLIFDQGFLGEYGFHTAAAGDPAPDWVTGSDSISGLAELIGTPRPRSRRRSAAGTPSSPLATTPTSAAAAAPTIGGAATRGTAEPSSPRWDHSTSRPTRRPDPQRLPWHQRRRPHRHRRARPRHPQSPDLGLVCGRQRRCGSTGRAYAGAGGALGPILILARRAGRHAANRGR
jgi:hypothetical protein